MAASCWQQLLLLLLVAVVIAEDVQRKAVEGDASETSVEPVGPTAAPLHRQKRHEIEIHRVIKRRPKLPPPPPPPRGRKPRPRRRPGSKPRVKYGPPNVNYPPLSHYAPQSIEDPFSSGFDSSFNDHHGSFGEPPPNYGSSIHPSPTFGSPPFAYGQSITSYEGSSFGKPSYEGSSFGKPSYEGSSFGKPSYEGASFGKPSYHGSSSFGKPSYESAIFEAGLSKSSFGNGPNVFDSKVPSFLDPSNGFDGFPGGANKHANVGGGYSHSYSQHSSGKYPHFADSTAINTYTTPSGSGSKGNFHSDFSSFGDGGSKHQLPLETYKKDPYKTPLTSYEVAVPNSKSNLFEPSNDFDYRRPNHNSGGVSSTHTTSHSTSGASEEYIPSLPTRYDQEQFHTPTKTNPNKPTINAFPTIGDNDPFTSFNSYYDGGSETQKVPIKSQSLPPFGGQDGASDEKFSADGSKRPIRSRRKKKPKVPGPSNAHNLDTDDLRDAFGSSSDFHQVAIDADEFLEFEPKKQVKHSKPAGVTLPRTEDDHQTSNFVLLSSQNKATVKIGGRGEHTSHRVPSSPSVTASKSIEYDAKNSDPFNYFQSNPFNQGHRLSKPSGSDDLSILSIQKSNSKSYYAGSSQANGSGGHTPEVRPTRRRDMPHYRSATSLDYTMLDEDDEEESYDDISDIGTRQRATRKKKDLSETTSEAPRGN